MGNVGVGQNAGLSQFLQTQQTASQAHVSEALKIAKQNDGAVSDPEIQEIEAHFNNVDVLDSHEAAQSRSDFDPTDNKVAFTIQNPSEAQTHVQENKPKKYNQGIQGKREYNRVNDFIQEYDLNQVRDSEGVLALKEELKTSLGVQGDDELMHAIAKQSNDKLASQLGKAFTRAEISWEKPTQTTETTDFEQIAHAEDLGTQQGIDLNSTEIEPYTHDDRFQLMKKHPNYYLTPEGVHTRNGVPEQADIKGQAVNLQSASQQDFIALHDEIQRLGLDAEEFHTALQNGVGPRLSPEESERLYGFVQAGVADESEVSALQVMMSKLDGKYNETLSQNGDYGVNTEGQVVQGDGKYGYATTEMVRKLSVGLTENFRDQAESLDLYARESTIVSHTEGQAEGAVFKAYRRKRQVKWPDFDFHRTPRSSKPNKKNWGSVKCPKF